MQSKCRSASCTDSGDVLRDVSGGGPGSQPTQRSGPVLRGNCPALDGDVSGGTVAQNPGGNGPAAASCVARPIGRDGE